VLSNGVVAVIEYGSVLVVEGTAPGGGADDRDEKVIYVATFAFMGATGEGDPDEVARIRDAIRSAKERGLTSDSPESDLCLLPGDGELANALDHANPWVRATARAFILAGGEALYPLATFALR
jgi:glyoxylase-like metal-dependent hydrolase (beta-lactamase superfamily II)